MTFYERLSALDASFLEIEDENAHMHVAATLLFEPGPLVGEDGGIEMERIRDYIACRLEHIPRYRQRLSKTPLEGKPIWIDDPSFNLFYHVRHTRLPSPGSVRQLKRLCGRIASQKLDRTKPLWEIWVVEGVEGGRFAFVTKVHHAMIDGVSGVDLLAVLLSISPDPGFEAGAPWIPRAAPTRANLLASEAWRRVLEISDMARSVAGAISDPWAALERVRGSLTGLAEALSSGFSPASDTLLNDPIGPHRRFDWTRLEMKDVKRVRSALGGTVNDVVLATVAGAVRRFLARRGIDVSDLDFRAMIPVSVRKASEHGALGNRVSQLVAPLPVAETDPLSRLRSITETTGRLKHSHQVEAVELLEGIGEWTASGVLGQLLRAATLRRPFNIVVTNVPGPPVPLYLLGARLLEPYPLVPLFVNQALGIALFSYDDGLYWGFNSDWDALPDLHDFATAIEHSFAELLGRAGEAESGDEVREGVAAPATG